LARSSNAVAPPPSEPGRISGPAPRRAAVRHLTSDRFGAWRSDGAARWLFIWPAVILVLVLSLFPLVASVALSFSKLVFNPGGVDLSFIGFSNYQQLLFGLERSHFLGVAKTPNPFGWAVFLASVALTGYAWTRSVRGGQVGVFGLALRLMGGLLFVGFMWLLVQTIAADGGRPGSLMVTVIFVFGGIALQVLLGLGLALLAVIIGDTWQWTPFVFIVLLAALEGLDQEVNEAALVDGAGRWQSFRHITIPAILPVTTTIVLIRIIEGFKIIDMPNILLGGGPGTATQSMTLQAYIDWSTLNLGRSAAVAYLLLILVTVVATIYVSFVRRKATDLA
jgi:multiple sugar transport system permease protein